MFYQESEIDEHLRCQYCKTKYNDPRLVDCGGSLCKMCIDLLIKDDANGLSFMRELSSNPCKRLLEN